MIFGTAVAAAAGLLTTVVNCVYRRPCAPFGFVFGHAAFFVSFFDVLSLTLLFVGVFIFVAGWHRLRSWTKLTQGICLLRNAGCKEGTLQ
jgi:hypothetical protein